MPPLIAPLANHLWQSTAFLAAIAVACVALRDYSPRLRYWLWLAASLKFLVPFSALVAVGASFEVPQKSVPVVAPLTAARLAYAFAPAGTAPAAAPLQAASVEWSVLLLCLWGAGLLGIAAWRFRQWLSLHSVCRHGQPIQLEFPLPVIETDSLIEPGIFGILRPVLLLPRGLRIHLTDEQFATLTAHELCHIRHRDNLTAAMHMVVEAVFWFYPLVWWIGARLIAERERACDQSVLAEGGSPQVYAESILSVCKSCLKSPLPCASGILGSGLKTRIRHIMTGRIGRPLNAARKAALSVAAIVVLGVPVSLGLLWSQPIPFPLQSSTVDVWARPSVPNGGGTKIFMGRKGQLQVQNAAVIQLMTFAYDVPAERFTDVPEWAMSEQFDAAFTPEYELMSVDPKIPPDQKERIANLQRRNMQAILRDRFELVLREKSREIPMYALTIAEGGPKLTAAATGTPVRILTRAGTLGRTLRLTATGAPVEELTMDDVPNEPPGAAGCE